MTTETTGYLVLKLRTWGSFEPKPGTFAPYPVSIQPEGLGFMVVYELMEEATAAADGGKVVAVRVFKEEWETT